MVQANYYRIFIFVSRVSLLFFDIPYASLQVTSFFLNMSTTSFATSYLISLDFRLLYVLHLSFVCLSLCSGVSCSHSTTFKIDSTYNSSLIVSILILLLPQLFLNIPYRLPLSCSLIFCKTYDSLLNVSIGLNVVFLLFPTKELFMQSIFQFLMFCFCFYQFLSKLPGIC